MRFFDIDKRRNSVKILQETKKTGIKAAKSQISSATASRWNRKAPQIEKWHTKSRLTYAQELELKAWLISSANMGNPVAKEEFLQEVENLYWRLFK